MSVDYSAKAIRNALCEAVSAEKGRELLSY